MKRVPKRKLLVEGDDDKRVIPYLVEANGIDWGPRNNPIVTIESFNGIEELLAPRVIETELKVSELDALGIMIDADDDCLRRWRSIKSHCLEAFPNLPETIPIEGLVAERDDGPWLGVWIMPDNQSSGMIETFLHRLIPDDAEPLLDYADQCLSNSRQHQAPWKDAHHDKALVHTWLAWQDPPGLQLHTAITANQLEPQSASAAAFIAWFRKLYRIAEN